MLITLARRMGPFVCVLAGLLGGATRAPAAAAPAGYKPFAADSAWNLPLRPDAPLHGRSAAYSGWLNRQVRARGAYINTVTCAMPVYWADPATPRVPVRLPPNVYQDPALLRAWASVPIPAGATPARCTDQNFAVIQRQPDGRLAEWEFWAAARQADGSWTARWGGAIKNVATDSGIASEHAWSDPTAPVALARVSRPGWNVTATSVSMIAGVITRRDVERRRIDHALSVALPDLAANGWLWPAQRTDGTSADPDAVPAGAHLRLDPALDLRAIKMVPLVRMMARAAQKYGIVVRDKTYNNTAFYTEEVRSGERDPFARLLGGKYPDAALQDFPWRRLRVLKASWCRGTATCTTPEVVRISRMRGARRPTAGVRLTLDTSNSTLNQPRTRVEWDLDGDGSYETVRGTAVKVSWTPARAGERVVRVRITTRGGSVVHGQRTIAVAPRPRRAR